MPDDISTGIGDRGGFIRYEIGTSVRPAVTAQPLSSTEALSDRAAGSERIAAFGQTATTAFSGEGDESNLIGASARTPELLDFRPFGLDLSD